MTPTDDMDSGQPTGTAGTPTPPSSAGNGDQPGSIDAAKLQATLDALTKRFDEVDARTKALQGEKDRGIKQTKKEVDDLKRKLAEIEKLRKSGLDEDDAIEELSFRDTVRSLKEQLAGLGQGSAQPAGNGKSMTAEATQVIEEFKLDPQSADVNRLYREYGDNPVRFAVEAGKLSALQASRPAPSPSAAPALQGEVPQVSGADIQKYRDEMLAAPRGNRKALLDIKEKHRKLGVPVDDVIFE